MRNHIFVQARIGSSRLPGKVLKKILGKTILALLIERLQSIQQIEKIIIVTGQQNKNAELILEAKKIGIDYFCGNEENILDRFYHASIKFNCENIIRITADCPLIDFNLITKALGIFAEKNVDILSINKIKTFPHGLDFEIFKQTALATSWLDNYKKYAKEEFLKTFIPPTVYMLEQEKFRHYNIQNEKDLSHIRLTLDYQEDLELITKIYESLYPNNKKFTLCDIMELLEKNPSLLNINKKHIKFGKTSL